MADVRALLTIPPYLHIVLADEESRAVEAILVSFHTPDRIANNYSENGHLVFHELVPNNSKPRNSLRLASSLHELY